MRTVNSGYRPVIKAVNRNVQKRLHLAQLVWSLVGIPSDNYEHRGQALHHLCGHKKCMTATHLSWETNEEFKTRKDCGPGNDCPHRPQKCVHQIPELSEYAELMEQKIRRKSVHGVPKDGNHEARCF